MSPFDLLTAAWLGACAAIGAAAVAFGLWSARPRRTRRQPGQAPDYTRGRARLAAELHKGDTHRRIHEIRQLNALYPDHPTWPRKEQQ